MARRTKRLALHLVVKLQKKNNNAKGDFDGCLVKTKDIGSKGFFLKTGNEFKKGTKFDVHIFLTGKPKPIHASGEVSWIAKKNQIGYYPGVGIKITDITPQDRETLNAYIKRKFQNYKHAMELRDMYLGLKSMGARLSELQEYHPDAENFRKVVDTAILQMDNLAHLLNKEIWEVKEL